MTRLDVAPAPDVPAPVGLPVRLHPGVRRLRGGRGLLGGSPLRLMTLTEAGVRVIDGWRGTSLVGDRAADRRLARRLLDAGILVPRPPPASSTAELSVVVPVRDRPAQLARCLDAVRVACPQSPVVVVCDGSDAPEPVHEVCRARGARLIRHDVCRGPAAARNTGLAACRTAYVGFVDSDVVLAPDSARRLLGHLSDPAVGAVAPRVCALAGGRGRIAGFEHRHSALDLGPSGGHVGPGRAIAYVPSTVMLARRAALGAGFDDAMRTGEDVDLVWRLDRAGWRVRYAPEVEVWHEHRVRLRSFVADRHRYARSAGGLARRHPTALPAARLSPAPALIWLLALAGRPRAALAVGGWAVARRRRALGGAVDPGAGLAAAVTARAVAGTGLALAHATRRVWSPALLLLAGRHRALRVPLLAAFTIGPLQDALTSGAVRIALGDAPLRLLDDVLAATGTWDGCLRERTLRPLLPTMAPARAGSR